MFCNFKDFLLLRGSPNWQNIKWLRTWTKQMCLLSIFKDYLYLFLSPASPPSYRVAILEHARTTGCNDSQVERWAAALTMQVVGQIVWEAIAKMLFYQTTYNVCLAPKGHLWKPLYESALRESWSRYFTNVTNFHHGFRYSSARQSWMLCCDGM
jgi:hypothetical protein